VSESSSSDVREDYDAVDSGDELHGSRALDTIDIAAKESFEYAFESGSSTYPVARLGSMQ
jgi:hypothetical protein